MDKEEQTVRGIATSLCISNSILYYLSIQYYEGDVCTSRGSRYDLMDQSILWKFRVINILSSVTLIFHKINDLNFKYLKSLAFVTVHTKTHGTNFGHVLGYWNVNVMSGTWVHKRTNCWVILRCSYCPHSIRLQKVQKLRVSIS